MKNLFCTIILLFIGIEASAKEEFTVFISQGKNLALVYKNTKNLEMGVVLSARDTVSVADSGYVALFHNLTGKVIEFKGKGLYGLQETDKAFRLVPGPPLYTFEELEPSIVPIETPRFRDGRYLYFLVSRNYSFYAFKEKVKLEWICVFDTKSPFKLELREDEGDDILFDTLVLNKFETILDFKAIVPKLKEDDEERFQLSIGTEDGEIMGSSIMIRFYDKDGWGKKVYDLISTARAFYGGNSAIESYVLGMIYQKKLLIANAFQAYKNAHQLAPHVKIFRDQYIEIGELPRNTK